MFLSIVNLLSKTSVNASLLRSVLPTNFAVLSGCIDLSVKHKPSFKLLNQIYNAIFMHFKQQSMPYSFGWWNKKQNKKKQKYIANDTKISQKKQKAKASWVLLTNEKWLTDFFG